MDRAQEIAPEMTLAPMGHNMPPVDPFDAFAAHIADLLDTASGFLDGEPVETEAVASRVSQLMDECRRAARDADAARAAEKRPHDEAAKAVQAKWKPLLEQVDRAVQVCKDALKPFLAKQEADKRAAALLARQEADEAARKAQEALRATSVTDLAAREQAEALLKQSDAAAKAATKAEADRGRVSGGSRAATLRTYYTAQICDATEAARWAWMHRRADCEEYFTGLAQQAVNSGARAIPGFTIIEEQRVV